jgi:hypothetical protein
MVAVGRKLPTMGMTIQAQSLGLATRQFRAFDRDGLTREFAVPPHWEVTTMSAFGRIVPDSCRDQDVGLGRSARREHGAQPTTCSGRRPPPICFDSTVAGWSSREIRLDHSQIDLRAVAATPTSNSISCCVTGSCGRYPRRCVRSWR